VVIPSYNGARKSANLTPLLAMLLQRFGVPVVVHGLLEGYGRITSGHVFREFGIMPAGTRQQAQQALDERGLVFVPLPAVAPGLANLLALRARMGVRNSAHSLVKMLDPFRGDGVLLAAATHPAYMETMRDVLGTSQAHALLLRATEGEPFANPKRRPRIEHLHDGLCDVLFESEHDSLKVLPHLPEEADAATTAAWTRKVLDGQIPLPQPIGNQLAACLYACGYANDFNEAKAIVAVEGNGHAVATA
jgi:anthranilate phosphoribosyltransferase